MEEKKNIYQKLIAVRKNTTKLQKQKGKQFDFVSSSQVLESVKEFLNEEGLLLIPEVSDDVKVTVYGNNKEGRTINTYFTEVKMVFTWVNAENPAETIKVNWYAQGVDIAGEKGVGKAYTYAEKYFLLKQFNISTDKDDPDVLSNKDKKGGKTEVEETEEDIANKKKLKNILFYKVIGLGKKAKDLTASEMKEVEEKMIEELEKITEFKGRDGKMVKGLRDFDKLTGNRLKVNLDKVVKSNSEIVKFLAKGS